jgi:hypothetical protein
VRRRWGVLWLVLWLSLTATGQRWHELDQREKSAAAKKEEMKSS